jgi:hypothetical protein
MKKVLFVLALVAVLVMGAHSMALGAIHPSVSDTGYWYEYPFNASGYHYDWGKTFPVLRTDTWFTITPDPSPLLYASGQTSNGVDKLGIGYLNDDFTFAEFISGSTYNNIKGSYLFSNNFFAGLDYLADKNTASDSTYLTLGYLFTLGGYKSDSYLAFSGDYFFVDNVGITDSGIYGYEVDLKYYGEKSKLIGQLIFSDNYDSPYMALQYNQAICDGEFVLAGRVVSTFSEETFYLIGGTWICSDNFVVDVIYGDLFPAKQRAPSDMWFVISGMFSVNDNLYLGAEYDKMTHVDDEYYIALKARYMAKKYNLTFYYRLGNDMYDSNLIIGFQKQL